MTAPIPEPGSLLAEKYRVVRQLGRGGMSTVFEAEHQVSGRRVALKWMHLASSSDPEASERFVREARATARLRHRNIVDVYDVEKIGDAAFLVMDLLHGETLGAWLARGQHRVEEAISVLLPAMRGVAHAHDMGVVHRDIKPDNIFLARQEGEDGAVPKVLDFGVSKVLDSEALSMTRAGATIGTPQYMSLEQLYGQKDVDHRTDIYAFGVILYEAITGRLPFEASAISELAVKIATTTPLDPRSFRPGLPGGLDKVIECALAKVPDQRYAKLGDMIEALRPFATPSAATQSSLQPSAAGAIAAQMPSSVSAQPHQPPSMLLDATVIQQLRRRRTRALGIGVALALVAVAALAFGLQQGREPTPSGHLENPIENPIENQVKPREPGDGLAASEASKNDALPLGRAAPVVAAPAQARARTRAAESSARISAAETERVAKPHRPGAPPPETTPATLAIRPESAPAQPTARGTLPPSAAPNPIVSRAPPQPSAAPIAVPPAPPHSLAAAQPASPQPTPLVPPQPARTPPPLTRPGPPSLVPAPPQLVAAGGRSVPLSANQLKRAYENKQLSKDDYRDYLNVLNIWRKQSLDNLRRALSAGQINRANYEQQAASVERVYRGQ